MYIKLYDLLLHHAISLQLKNDKMMKNACICQLRNTNQNIFKCRDLFERRRMDNKQNWMAAYIAQITDPSTSELIGFIK